MSELPTTPRGQRTRSALIDAARVVFERDGYLDARVSDITEAANVAHGTFYTYFTGKEDIMGEVYKRFRSEMVATSARDPSASTPEEAIENANRQYLEQYQKVARLFEVFDEASIVRPEMWTERDRTRQVFVRRVRRHLGGLRAGDRIDPELDLDYTAEALCCMVERFAYMWFNRGADYEMEQAVLTLSRLWMHAIQLTPAYELDRVVD